MILKYTDTHCCAAQSYEIYCYRDTNCPVGQSREALKDVVNVIFEPKPRPFLNLTLSFLMLKCNQTTYF